MQGEQASKDGEATTAPPGVSAGASGLFGAFGKRYYDGGFDEKMTRKEAALILGVRESAAAQRIKVSGLPSSSYTRFTSAMGVFHDRDEYTVFILFLWVFCG